MTRTRGIFNHHRNDWSSPSSERQPVPVKTTKESDLKDERLRIMELIRDGKITPAEGLELLEALGLQDAPPTASEAGPEMEDEESDEGAPRKKARWLHIKVHDAEDNKHVNIKIPISLAKFAGKFIPREAREEMAAQGVDFDLEGLMDILEKGGEQELVDVEEGDGSKTVKIYIK
jgi:hypothetical protein